MKSIPGQPPRRIITPHAFSHASVEQGLAGIAATAGQALALPNAMNAAIARID